MSWKSKSSHKIRVIISEPKIKRISLTIPLCLKLEFSGQVFVMVILSVPDSNSPENVGTNGSGAGTGAFGTFMGTFHLKN